ncbi:hypothetical protein QFC21_002873 [Naganishia friedmannii]|uniref:Uncharacterized protein n=1 Tax=Naganishia friedmannii TaxID=89922 RepID=A0ACC2VSU4_9TREE|nr:hypothetical protein QFC21_002873 [Naganishia friedmannii]
MNRGHWSRATIEAKRRMAYGAGGAWTGSTHDRPTRPTATLSAGGVRPTQASTTAQVETKDVSSGMPAQEEENEEDDELHCLCRQPEDGKTMIQCDDCNEWYHLSCVKLRQVQVELIDQYICPPCTDRSGGERKSTRKTDLPPPITKRKRNITPPLELSSPEPMPLPDSSFPVASAPIQEEREYSPFPFARPPAAVSLQSSSPPFGNGSSTPASQALAPHSPLRLTPPLVMAPTRKRKASEENVPAPRHESIISPEQDNRWEDHMDVQSGAENAEGSGSGGFDGRTALKKRKSLTIVINRSKAKPSKEARPYEDDDQMMDHLDLVPEEREINRAKANGKRRLVAGKGKEHMQEQAADSHAFKVDFRVASTRPRPVKTTGKVKDGNGDRVYDYGRRSGGSDNKDTTGDEDAITKVSKRKPPVSPKISTVKVKRRPVHPKPRPMAATKASSSAVATTSIAEDLLAQRGAPEPGPTENAVRGHCVGKLENAFINVFLTFFRALVPNPTPGQKRAVDGTVRKSALDRNGIIDGDFMEVDPPIRITEPIVLDHDDAPKEIATAITESSSANPLRTTDSGTVNPVSSSIEILTAPQSSQHSIEHIANGNASHSINIAGYVNLVNGTIDEPRITDDAVIYAQEVEACLFNKLKEFSREKRLWLPGAAYKQQYNLIISSLEGDLRPDLREGFATRKLTPADVASMNSRNLASTERLKEMKVYEEEALKSLLRIDDGKPAKIIKDGVENSEEATHEASTSQAIDLDMIIFDVDENDSASTSQLENANQASQSHAHGSTSLREQRIPNSRPLSIASSSALQRPDLTAESDLIDSAVDSEMPFLTNPLTPVPHSPASPGGHGGGGTDDTSDGLTEALVEKYYDNHVEDGSLWTATSSKHHEESLTEEAFRHAPTVWQGEIHNPGDTSHPIAKVYARQAAGPDCSSYQGVWSLIFPSDTLHLVGRVTTKASVKYIEQNQVMVHRELIIVAFSPAGDDEASKADFESLVDFHHARDRHGRVTPWNGVETLPAGAPKEMYLVPLKPDESFDFLDFMPESVLPKVRTENFLLGVFLIAKTGNLLFPPEVLGNQLPVTASSGADDVVTGTDGHAPSRQGSASAVANAEGDQPHQSNGTNKGPAPPSDLAPSLPPC